MQSTFRPGDCQFLLKDLTGVISFTDFEHKELAIAQGHNYSEMIAREQAPSPQVEALFKQLTQLNATLMAQWVSTAAAQIWRRGGAQAVIVSLARAGSPVGALIKRYLLQATGCALPHYSISIIRDRGIDTCALDYITTHHPQGVISFVDGWTGKGSITRELHKAVAAYNAAHGTRIDSTLAVLADPARLSPIASTKKDVCVPNACLNSTVSGLVSRTILNRDYSALQDFHGAVRYIDLLPHDLTNWFLDTIAQQFDKVKPTLPASAEPSHVKQIIAQLAVDFPVADINKVKLGICEASRSLIRRKPYVLLVKDPRNPQLAFNLHMAHERGVEVLPYDTGDYQCIALIK